MGKKKRNLIFIILLICGLIVFFLIQRKNTSLKEPVFSNPVQKKDSIISATLLTDFYDLESNKEIYISNVYASSGKNSCVLKPDFAYGFSTNKTIGDIPSYNTLKNVNLHFNSLHINKNTDALYVLTINDSEGKMVYWDGQPIAFNDTGKWVENQISYGIAPEFLNPQNKIIIYPWNRNKKTFFIDNIRIDYIGTKIYQNDSTLNPEKTNLFFDFESESELSYSDKEEEEETTAHSGIKAYHFNRGAEFGPSLKKTISTIGKTIPQKINMSVWIYPIEDNINALLTVAITNSKNETIFWDGKSTESKSFPKNKWTKLNAAFLLPTEKFSQYDIFNAAIWNKGKTKLIIDDLEIVIGESPERRGNPSTINMNEIYQKHFVAEKNKPPFRTIYFEKQEINNGNSISITPYTTDTFSPNDEFFAGDFFINSHELDEILCIKKGRQGLFTYLPEKKQFFKLWENTNPADSIWNNDNQYYCGDYNSDGKTDILSVEKKTKQWALLNFNENKWTVVSKGENPKTNWILNKETKNKNTSNVNDIILSGKYIENKQTFLKLNKDWRFDLKLIERKNDENIILGNIDFKGYPKDYNPKYFEFIKIVPGNFIFPDNTSLLILMCNCKDFDFSGRYCKQIENLSYLPNSTQLYTLPENAIIE